MHDRAAALAEEVGHLRGRLADSEAEAALQAAGVPGGVQAEAGDLGELRAALAALEAEKADWDAVAAQVHSCTLKQ